MWGGGAPTVAQALCEWCFGVRHCHCLSAQTYFLCEDGALRGIALVTPCSAPSAAAWTFQQPTGDSGDLLEEFALTQDDSMLVLGYVLVFLRE